MLQQLEKAIGYEFRDKSLLAMALVHSSFSNEHKKEQIPNNERLEFLGDAALELASSRYLYEHFPDEPEGVLSRRRAAIVCEPSLAECARTVGLGRHLQLGKGEEKNNGRERDSLLSDAFEAVIGAMFLDGGFTVAERFVRRFVMEKMTDKPVYSDSKTALQETVQSSLTDSICYELLSEEGPEHNKTFTVEVKIGGLPYGTGSGHNKKIAEQEAAAAALERLKKETQSRQ